jgi:protein-tyrosine phosphatase
MIDQMQFEKTVSLKIKGDKKRHLPFIGAKNFRDLGGYETVDHQTICWNLLYRSDALHRLTRSDLRNLSALMLGVIIDFRTEHEKVHAPDRLPDDVTIRVVEISIMDSSTQVLQNLRKEFVGDAKKIDPAYYMPQTNIELATRFTPQMKQFICELLSANGQPILFHCTAGKDRTGFASAILLRILGVPLEKVMEDYLLTNQYFLQTHRWHLIFATVVKGKKFAEIIKGFMQASPKYLGAAFEAIDREYGSFENYIYAGLNLSKKDVEQLKLLYLE